MPIPEIDPQLLSPLKSQICRRGLAVETDVLNGGSPHLAF